MYRNVLNMIIFISLIFFGTYVFLTTERINGSEIRGTVNIALLELVVCHNIERNYLSFCRGNGWIKTCITIVI